MGVNGIYGLSGSGLDIESMVKVGMMSKQNEYDKMAQKYTTNEWTKNALIEINNQITTFNMSSLTDYKLSSKMNARNATSSNEAAVTATANATSAIMSHKVSVNSLSHNAYLIGSNRISDIIANTQYYSSTHTVTDAEKAEAETLASTANLKDILFQNLTYNATTDSITGTTMNSYDGTNSTVKDNTDGSYTLTGSRTVLRGSSIQLEDTALEFTIADSSKDSTNTATIKFTYGDLLGDNDTGAKPKTMNDLVSEINKQATNNGINVKATYDNLNGVFSIYNPKGDDESSVVIKAVDNNSSYQEQVTMNFLNALGLKEFVGTNLGSAKMATGASGGKFDATGKNGTITVDGMEYKTKDNKVTVGGVTYNFLNTTAANEAVTVTVGQDVDAIVDKVKSFVESYNKILGDLYAKYDEKKESGYSPLTQTQKDSMKDEQIEKWEEKAKKGLLYHDSTLSKIITQMRNAVSGTIEGVDGKYNSVYSIGISTTGIKGQLVLDETKLKNALAEDSESVYNVFAKLTTEDENGVTLSDSESYNRSGIAQRLGDIFTSATKLIRERAGSSTDITEDSSLNNLLRELQTKMSNFKKLMTAFEDRLYKKYDAMEVTLSKLGSQLNFITGGQ
jgi:flagellar hook-associated protein 2